MFTEELYKDTTKKLEVKLVRNEESLLTSWQISDFISQLTKHYYKNELLNTISLALKHGVSPKNIIIFEDSFEINNPYANLRDLLNFEKTLDVRTFYHLGEPISMFPNQEIIAINSVFSYFRRINKILGSNRIPRISKNMLQKYYAKIRDKQSHESIIDEIETLAFSYVQESANPNINEETFDKRVKKLTKESLSSYSKYEKELETIQILSDKLEANDTDTFKNNKYQQLERDYYNSFFSKFEGLKRPIVGIFNNETQEVQILCQGFLTKAKHDSSRFLDMKSISHNSPYEALFTIGIPIVVPLISVLNVAITTRSLDNEYTESEAKRELAENNVIETLRRLDSLTDIEEIKAVEEIPQEYIKNNIKEVRELNSRRFQEPIEKYGFVNCKIEVNVIQQASPKQLSNT